MSRLSDTTLRRLAWVVPVFYGLLVAGRVVLNITAAVDGAGNDFHNAPAELMLYGVVASLPVTALVILRRQPRNTIGWILMGAGLVWCIGGVADTYARYALLVQPGSLPHPELAAAVNAVIWAPALGLMGTFLILLFPDGRLPSPRWRPVAWVCALTIVGLTLVIELTPGRIGVGPAPQLQNPFGVESARPVLAVLEAVLLPLLPACMLACAVALVLRFRRSTGVERLQMKWLASAAGVVAVLYLAAMVVPVVWRGLTASAADPGWMDLVDNLSLTSFMLLPVAIGIAVLRHRLYDIDVVLNRTLVYGSLSLTLAAMYVGSVLLLQTVLNPLTRDSELAVAGSTLVVAALFRPLRTRIQSVVDRRFYRSRYDAARTLDAFTARVRNDVDVESVGADLRATVAETVHPSHLSLWLRP